MDKLKLMIIVIFYLKWVVRAVSLKKKFHPK
jgi:hypothetical protein